MEFREFLAELRKEGKLLEISKEVSLNLEAAKLLNQNQDKAVIFSNLKESNFKLVGNVFSSRERVAKALETTPDNLLKKINDAIDNPSEPEIEAKGKCQEITAKDVNLYTLPLPKFTSKDGGRYLTSGVFIVYDEDYGYNLSFHRAMIISRNKLVIRVCKRHLYQYLQKNPELNAAIVISPPPSVLVAAAISTKIETNELEVANSLREFKVVKTKTSGLVVPESSEVVLEGVIKLNERAKEGPFLDITGTYDKVREEPIVEINLMSCRRDAIFHTILPSSLEHKILMGMPREAMILREVSKCCKCIDVSLTKGGCSWLHGVVKIDKLKEDDGRKAIEAAFKAHPSLKHVIVVDNDIDIHDPEAIEWALATRFQAGKDMIMKFEHGSSLDPSAENELSYKLGLDATIPSKKEKAKFLKGELGK